MDRDTHIHLHFDGEGHLLTKELEHLKEKLQLIMATIEDFSAVLARIDTATNQIAADLKALKDQIAGAGLSAAVEADVLAQLDAKAKALEAIGKSTAPPTP